MRKVTTGKPVSDKNSDAYTHREKREMETLLEALGRSAEQRQPPENLHKATTKRDGGEELGPIPTTLRPRQNAIPHTIHLCLFYNSRGEAVTTRYIIFILCPFGQRYTSIFYVMNACDLGFSHQPTCT